MIPCQNRAVFFLQNINFNIRNYQHFEYLISDKYFVQNSLLRKIINIKSNHKEKLI